MPGESHNDDPMRKIKSVRPQLFDVAASSDWIAHLKRFGFVVLRSFLSEERRRELLSQFWTDFLSACRKTKNGRGRGVQRPVDFSTVSRHDRESWIDARVGKHAALHIAQSDFFWELRTEPRVAEVYGKIFNVDPSELCVSLDSYALNMKGHPERGLPLHDDQAEGVDERSNMYSVQGSYNFFAVTEADTGLTVVPSSHSHWTRRRAGRHQRHKSHFVMISGADKDYESSYASARKLLIPRNCFVLWTSKTLHGTTPGSRERLVKSVTPPASIESKGERLPEQGAAKAGAANVSSAEAAAPSTSAGNVDKASSVHDQVITPAEAPSKPLLNRLTCFVAMLPKALRPLDQVQGKVAVYKSGGSTSHWACAAETHPVNVTGPIRGRLDGKGNIPPQRFSLL